MNNFGKKNVFILLLGLGVLASPGWTQPSKSESLTHYLGYLDSLKGCVQKGDLKECYDVANGHLLETEQKSVEKIQKEIQEKCIDKLDIVGFKAFNCYLSWVSGAYDTIILRISQLSEIRKNAMGEALYIACNSNDTNQKHKVKKCFNGCDNNSFKSCKKAIEICLTTKDRDAMEVCVLEEIDISSNKYF